MRAQFRLKLTCALVAMLLQAPIASSGQSTAIEYCNQGNALLRAGRYREAIEMLNQATMLEPTLAEAYFLRAQSKEHCGDASGALQDAHKALSIAPKDERYVQEYKRLLLIGVKNGDPNVQIVQAATGHRLNGDRYMSAKQYVPAISEFTEALKEAPKDDTLYTSRGNALQCAKQYSEAIADYSTAITMHPDDGGIYALRGQAESALNMLPEALHDFNVALRYRPDSWVALDGRGCIYAKQGYNAQALADFNKALAVNPADDSTYHHRAQVLAKMGSKNNAYADAMRSDKMKDPTTALEFENRARDYLRLKQYAAAANDFSKAIALAPNSVSGYMGRGRLYFQTSQFDYALNDFTKAIALSADPSAYYFRAMCYKNTQKYSFAIDDLTRVIKTNPTSLLYKERGDLYEKLGQHSLAIKDMEMSRITH